jgi:glycosyltransferase involved in cell wall biosynthesis
MELATQNTRVDEANGKVPIVCLSTQDYNDLWTRKQRFMTNFARLGHRVLYVESQWHLLTYLKQLPSGWRRIFKFLRVPRELEPNLFVATPPLLLPFFQMLAPLATVNNFILGLWLRHQASHLQMNEPLAYTYVPYSHLAIKLLGSKKILYEKVDDYAAAKGLLRKATVEKLEKRLLKTAQLVIVTASRLKTKMQGHHANVHLIPNGCETQHFRKVVEIRTPASVIAELPRPRIGFVGALAYWCDLDLIEHLARNRPHWQFVFIGPQHTDVRQLKALANVHMIGRVPYSMLPTYMTGIDVFINPYKQDDIAESCSPLKVFEYLAAGKPVVSVPMREVMRFAPHVRIAGDYRQFLQSIEELLQMPLAERERLSRTLQSLVRDDTWTNRFNTTRQVMAEEFGL